MADPANEVLLAEYGLDAHGLKVTIRVTESPADFVPIYNVIVKGLGDATKILLISLRTELLSLVPIDPTRIEDKAYVEELNSKYIDAANLVIDKYLPSTTPEVKKILIAYVINIMLGLGDLEIPLSDDNLEEITVNSSKDPLWVFHKKFGWCKSNIKLHDETLIYDDAEQIGRRVGRQISNLSPLMDAELPDGSRVNATLYPISQRGNTITIRKFAKNPWTMPSLIGNKSISSEVAAIMWLCIQNEISLLISGGTASGKTSFLNALSVFMPENHRIISVEETRELTLPSFLHWVPMITRQPNPEGKGEISLYNLMINALRQRPDIMLIGEIRTEKDAETLFEAIHTGHAVYGTVHADSAQDTIIRMTNPPINIPKLLINAIGGIVTLFRHRRLGIRRVLEFGEILRTGDANVLYRWNLRSDTFMQVADLSRLAELIMLYGGYTRSEIVNDIKEKSMILDWMVANKYFDVDVVGTIVAHYYKNKDELVETAAGRRPFDPAIISRGI
ncbi:MAG: CpaF family protein [Candidatus Micrarchaeota archaeon]|nr:CpaF family protein [Candidatus Micrarchaeota archaeon]MDE1804759.1 CpaF family protein [Candidatus Micrarchaeota archaeon]MDE1847091.1 CpaF family protein [Candidatus Micrarchaeota archaeon]